MFSFFFREAEDVAYFSLIVLWCVCVCAYMVCMSVYEPPFIVQKHYPLDSAPVKIVDGVQAKQRLQVYAKKEAVMTCQAVAVPPATVTWKKGNSPIEGQSSFSSSEVIDQANVHPS